MHLHRSAAPLSQRLSLAVVALTLIATVLAIPGASAADIAPKRCDIVGTDGPDVLVGTSAGEVICGLGGDDVLYGLGGDDELLGGSGSDMLLGGLGNDRMLGHDDEDELFGGPGADELRGGNGADHLVGGAGNDVLRGGNAGDTLAGGAGADVLRGGNGNDVERGAGGNDTLWGGPGDDILRGGAGNDRLRGGPDADICADSFAKTNGINCEFGRGGDDRAVAVNQQLWNLNGNSEFVYELSITEPCNNAGECEVTSFGATVHVLDDVATSRFGNPAFTAAELFALAETAEDAGRKVAFDPAVGLPTIIDNAAGGTLGVSEIGLRDELRADYNAAVERWANAGITTYSYTLEVSCFCPFNEPVSVTVRDGVVTSEPTDPEQQVWPGNDVTIDEHLANLGEVLDSPAIEVRAEFDSNGVPTLVSVDEVRAIVDEERSIIISDFVVPEAAATPTPVEPAPEEPELGEVEDDAPANTPGLPELTIVSVRGIEVSAEIADDVEALLAAADDAGFTLSGGGFRDPQRQIELRKANCGTTDFDIFEKPASECSPPTARPGQSQHELGLAIDFTSSGRPITSQSDPAFIWLAANAGTFGFINLASEPWHFSTTGN